MLYAEIIFISAKTGQRTQKLFDTIDMVLENQTLADPDGCAQRDPYRGDGDAAAAVRPWKAPEDLLYDTGICEAADLCDLCQR